MVGCAISRAEQRLWHITTPDGADREFRRAILRRLPAKLADAAAGRYLDIYSQSGLQAANNYLLYLQDRLPPHALSIASHDEDLRRFAKLRAERCAQMAAKRPADEVYLVLSQMARDYGLEPPKLTKHTTLTGLVNRLCDEQWWRTSLRRTLGRTIEQVAIELGFVHKRAGIYVSDETLTRRREQKTRNRSVLEGVTAVNEQGDEFTLAELADLSVSNPKLRRNELMTRIAGFELVAQQRGDMAVMYTLTCPSRMHARYARSGDPVQSYDGTTPRQANEYLGRVWARIRSKLEREGVKLYGMRVVEPMHDGTPHVHFLLFMAPKISEKVESIFRKYALQEDGDEPGAEEHRFNVQKIDPEKGTATGYIAKYISKNIDGFGVDCDLYGREASSSAERVEAWAATWGIRQFQQVGGPPVTVWRELRRLGEQTNKALERVRQAADRGDWAEFTELMGGPTIDRKSQPVKLKHAFNEEVGRYGEPKGDQIIGLEINGETVIRPGHDWEFRWAPSETGVDLVVTSGDGPERNCTQFQDGAGTVSESGPAPVPKRSSPLHDRAGPGAETGASPNPGRAGTGPKVSDLLSEKGARSASGHLEFCQ